MNAFTIETSHADNFLRAMSDGPDDMFASDNREFIVVVAAELPYVSRNSGKAAAAPAEVAFYHYADGELDVSVDGYPVRVASEHHAALEAALNAAEILAGLSVMGEAFAALGTSLGA